MGRPDKNLEHYIFRGIDTPERLLAWFKAKGHRNLVLRTADVFELAPIDQEDLADLLCKAVPNLPTPTPVNMRLWFQNRGRHIVTAIDDLIEKLDMKDIARLQEIIGYYIEGRRGKGEPSKVEPCDCTDGGRSPQPNCRLCDGTGRIHVLLEVTDEELQLANGGV
jgi:hypothetical protein